mmetsp:Transcript_32843/g.73131  ORF Transcript_32843/g.73131 Transcript_32843/m.73131 type:complete len:142 (-) Transcript_32843:187-612(-)
MCREGREGGDSEAGPRESDMTSGSGQVTVKMDAKAFIRAAEIDDVLLQAIWRRPRGCLRELLSQARMKAQAKGCTLSVAQVIEQDLMAVLEPAIKSAEGTRRKSHNSASFGRNAMSAALGFAGKIVESASSLQNELIHSDD